MLKITIDNEEVLSNKNFTIEEEMLNTPSVILDNVYPKSWENDKDYVNRFYHPNDYSKCLIKDEIYTPAEPGLNVEGTSFQIEADTTKRYELTSMKGNTTQSSTPTPTTPVPVNVVSGRQDIVVAGKNLLDYQYSNLNNITRSTASEEENGFKLTSTGVSGYGYGALTLDNSLLGQTITISMTSSGNKTPSGRLFYVRDNGTIGTNVGAFWTTNNSHTETLPNTLPSGSKAIALVLYISQGNNASGDYAIFQNIQIEKGSTATTYEAYNGNTYEINLGKNLFDVENGTRTYGGQTYSIEDNIFKFSSTTVSGGISAGAITPYTSYSFDTSSSYVWSLNKKSGNWTKGSSYPRVLIYIKYSDNTTSYSQINLNTDNQQSASNTITFTSGKIPVSFAFGIYAPNGSLSNNVSAEYYVQLEKGSSASSFSPYKTPIELCKIGNYQDRIYKNGNKWYLEKNIGKVVLNGSETYSGGSVGTNVYRFYKSIDEIMAYTDSSRHIDRFITDRFKLSTNNEYGATYQYQGNLYFCVSSSEATTYNEFKTWLGTHNTSVYYVLATPTTTEITDRELISQLNSIELLEGLNNVSVVSPYLQGIINLHYNFQDDETTSNLLFCGVVKNSGNISLNPRYPHYQSLQILDFKTFLSEGETLDFVIANKTIKEAIDQIISTIAPYGFVKGNIQIIGANTIIGAYSTKDKTAYDVFNYIADITQSRWTTRLIDENTVAIDFYDPTLLPQGTPINYTASWFRDNLIDDMSYSYGSNDYRNKQVMTSNEVYGNILQTQTIVANGYQTQFDTELKIGQITSITANGTQLTIATNEQKELGFNADIYYTPGNNYFESADLRSTGEILIVNYIAIVEGRQIITNGTEINRVATATGRKGIVARYENRNDATTSNELQLIGQSYIKYKGVPEIKLTITSRSNLWNIGDRVQFNAPINELDTEYMVKKKTINRILANPSSEETIFYTFELTSSFNSEQAINYFDNQRAKAKGNIGAGEYITRNVDIESNANIIFYDNSIEEVSVDGDNVLNSILNSPFNN